MGFTEKQGFGEGSVPRPSLSYLQMQFILVRSEDSRQNRWDVMLSCPRLKEPGPGLSRRPMQCEDKHCDRKQMSLVPIAS